MGNPKKKPAVEPEKANEWLRRLEEKGDSAPNIAKADGYDVRTVRKALEKAREQRERTMARGQVLRNALEQHYADIVTLVEGLENEVTRDPGVFHLIGDDRLVTALKQHIPKWPMWRLIERLEGLNDEIHQTTGEVRATIQKQLLSQIVGHSNEFDLNAEGFIRALVDRAGFTGVQVGPELRTGGIENGRIEISYGLQKLGAVPLDKQDEVSALWVSLVDGVVSLPESEELKRVVSERNQTMRALVEEFETIKLRRVVPGKCKYCPI